MNYACSTKKECCITSFKRICIHFNDVIGSCIDAAVDSLLE